MSAPAGQQPADEAARLTPAAAGGASQPSLRWGEPRAAWWALFACTLTIVLASGTRTSLAAFLKPIEAELSLDRATLSNVGALMQLSYGLVLPLVGHAAARYGARAVYMAAVVAMAVAGFGVATAQQAWQLYLFAGLLPGLAYGGAGHIPAAVLLSRWFKSRLGLAAGIATSGVPAGPSLFVPIAVALIPYLGWRGTYIALGLILAGLALPVLWLAAREPPSTAPRRGPTPSTRVRAGADIWLIGFGYFGCGFTDQFVTLHLVTLALEAGIEPLTAAGSLSLVLLVGVAGSVLSGPLADRFRPAYILTGLYLTRAISLPLLLLAGPGSGLAALTVFGVLFGLTYISNQAPGARYVRDNYGIPAVGPLMGHVGLIHQVGGAIGISIGGLSVTHLGGYGPAVLTAAAVAFCASLLQLLIGPAARRRGFRAAS